MGFNNVGLWGVAVAYDNIERGLAAVVCVRSAPYYVIRRSFMVVRSI
jgi:hypothetical protein